MAVSDYGKVLEIIIFIEALFQSLDEVGTGPFFRIDLQRSIRIWLEDRSANDEEGIKDDVQRLASGLLVIKDLKRAAVLASQFVSSSLLSEHFDVLGTF